MAKYDTHGYEEIIRDMDAEIAKIRKKYEIIIAEFFEREKTKNSKRIK
jgi:hypothetical protein